MIEQTSNPRQARQELLNVFDIVPTTFILHSQFKTTDMHKFIKRFSDIEINQGLSLNESVPYKHCSENLWLLKPATLNQGRGIQIFSKIKEINDYLESQSHTNSYYVIQKYIEKPLLFKGRKFDIRVWALVTIGSNYQHINVYMYQEGYLRTSSSAYDLSDENKYVHLTNNCLQQKGDLYGQHEEGNTLGYSVFQEYLDKQFPQYKVKVQEHFIPRMKDIIIDTILSVKTDLNPGKRKNCFELLGYDFLIDEDFRLWLLEVNQNPYLGTPNPFIGSLLPQMIQDMMNLTLDPIIDEPLTSVKKQNNKFELILSHDESINQRRAYTVDFLYPVQQLKQQNGLDRKKEILTQRKQQYKIKQSLRVQLNHSPHPEKNFKMNKTYDHDSYQSIKQQDDFNNTKYNSRKLSPQNNQKELLDQSQGFLEQRKRSLCETPLYNDKNEVLIINENSMSLIQKIFKENSQIIPQRKNYEKDIIEKVFFIMNLSDSIVAQNAFDQLFHQIFSRIASWELFNSRQIDKSLKAFAVLSHYKLKPYYKSNIYYQKILNIATNELTPIKIRMTLLEMIEDHSRVLLKRQFLLELPDQIYQIGVLIQNESEHNKSLCNLAYLTLVNIISLDKNSGKIHIPGYSKEVKKIRLQALDKKILLFFMSLYFEGKYKQEIEEDIIANLVIEDIEYQLKSEAIDNAHHQVKEFLQEKLKKMLQDQQQWQEYDKLTKQKNQEKEDKFRQQIQEERDQKRKFADQQFQKRMDEKKRYLIEEKKKLEREMEQQGRELEEKRKIKEEERRIREQMWKIKQNKIVEKLDLKEFKVYQPILKKSNEKMNKLVSQSIVVTKEKPLQEQVDSYQTRDQKNLSYMKKINERSHSEVKDSYQDNIIIFNESQQLISPRLEHTALQINSSAYNIKITKELSPQKPQLKDINEIREENYGKITSSNGNAFIQLGKNYERKIHLKEKKMPELPDNLKHYMFSDSSYQKKKQKQLKLKKSMQQRASGQERVQDKANFTQVLNHQEKRISKSKDQHSSQKNQNILPSIDQRNNNTVNLQVQLKENLTFLKSQKEKFANRSNSFSKSDPFETKLRFKQKKAFLSPMQDESIQNSIREFKDKFLSDQQLNHSRFQTQTGSTKAKQFQQEQEDLFVMMLSHRKPVSQGKQKLKIIKERSQASVSSQREYQNPSAQELQQ